MSNLKHLFQILQNHLGCVALSGGSEFRRRQRFLNLCLARHVNRNTITECSRAISSRVQFAQRRIQNDADLRGFVHEKRHRNARVRIVVHKIHRAIDGIDYPCGIIGEFHTIARAGSGAGLFTNESYEMNNNMISYASLTMAIGCVHSLVMRKFSPQSSR